MEQTEVLMGNHSASIAVQLARTQVIPAYPITPQTQIVEELSEICASGKLNAKFIKVESEHSAMACCIGASLAGARAFTATSSQGLALMHELLFWAAYGRLPIVMVNVNRAMAPGWSIWSDQTDSLAQRDTGWIQLYCETNQEVLDTLIVAYKLAESVNLPVMVVYDAFILSHTYEPVTIPSQKSVDKFLPPYKPEFKLDLENPRTFFSLTGPECYMEFRYIAEQAYKEAFEVYQKISSEFEKQFGRKYSIAEEVNTDDAETLIVTSGSLTGNARVAIDQLRKNGEKVGLVKLKMFRPFPVDTVKNIFCKENVKKIVILDRNISHGSGGIWASEIKSSLFGMAPAPKIHSFLIGLGGRDTTPNHIIEAYNHAKENKAESSPVWIGLKE